MIGSIVDVVTHNGSRLIDCTVIGKADRYNVLTIKHGEALLPMHLDRIIHNDTVSAYIFGAEAVSTCQCGQLNVKDTDNDTSASQTCCACGLIYKVAIIKSKYKSFIMAEAKPKKTSKVKIADIKKHGTLLTKDVKFDHAMQVRAYVLLIEAKGKIRKLCFNLYNGSLGRKADSLSIDDFVVGRHNGYSVNRPLRDEVVRLVRDGYQVVT